ncbi:acyl-CoA dehydrogenase family protein [Fibrella aquatilis]|uniref:Acyl-CoA dehydrogenase family protein n=1 Tax=Fibrella aquatilis TaxID=2817059 RepID=A0A939G0I3_9BACT|nr:acyl-CoA dehydrogenase family protein [Fibrella aquatilis]MBO0930147.1 acyl-CoA dehydrogenase family protein [Fibrella aquatilis]
MISREQSTKQTAYTDPEALAEVLAHVADLATETDTEGDFPEEAFQLLAQAGLLAVTLPGQPLDHTQGHTAQLLTLLKRVGSANLAVGRVYEGHINALLLAQLFGNPEQRQQWHADVRQHHLFSVWNTQADDGILIHELGGGRYELEGYKTFCSGANWVSRPLVTGELMRQGHKSGWQMCIIPTERIAPLEADARFWKPLGMRASASFKLNFTGIVLDESDLLGKPGNYFQQPYFSGGAIRFAAVQLGGAEALLEATRLMLRSMGRVDDVFQQMRLAEMACQIESGNLWLTQAGANNDAWLHDGTDPARIVAYANMTRTAIEAICLRVMHLCEKSVGARGLLRPLPFERIHRDLTMYLRQPAPDATLVDIGRWVGHQTTATHDLWT